MLLQLSWASSGNPVNPGPSAHPASVLLGALLPHISNDLGLQTMIFNIYTKDMRTTAMMYTTELSTLLSAVTKRQQMALVFPSSFNSSLACLDKSAKLAENLK